MNLSKEKNSQAFELLLPQVKLADLFGVTRPALGRVIRELHNDKIIFADGKKIKILDKIRLIELIK